MAPRRGSTTGLPRTGPRVTVATMAAADEPSFPGYRVLRFLRGGRLSDLYLARPAHLSDDHPPVVIKAVKPAARQRPSFVEGFAREMEGARRLRHPNLVELRDVVATAQACYVVMEYLDGHTLVEVAAACHALHAFLPHRILTRVACDVLRGLDHLHGHGGVVHG